MNVNYINYPVPKQEYKVLVRCFTYNQSKYIVEALNGFAMQQTNFPFVCLVMDDASSDGEQEVIKAWMEHECDMDRAETIDIATSVVIIVPHKTNTTCTFAFYLLKQNLYGTGNKKMNHIYPWREKCEYEAICEGDDYWIDPLKLQKQVSFLDKNPEYSFCHTGFNIYEQSRNKFIDSSDIIRRNMTPYRNTLEIIENILDKNNYRIQTVTVLVRLSEYLKAYEKLKPFNNLFLMGDTQLWLSLLSFGKVFFIPEITSVYRVNEGSACRSNSIQARARFALSCTEMRVFFGEIHNISHQLQNRFQHEYKKELLKYKILDPEYKPFVKCHFDNVIDKIIYSFIISKFCLFFISPILSLYYKKR